MELKNVVFDVDGVLANFMDGALKVGYGMAGITEPIPTHQSHWDDYGLLKGDQITRLWAHIANTPEFWGLLEPTATLGEFSGIYDLIKRGHRVYFATNRRLPGSLGETVGWLSRFLNWEYSDSVHPNVIITKRKGEFCKVVGADFYIDDKSENVDCAIWMTDGNTKSYVLTRPYNVERNAPHSHKAQRVETVAEFLAEVNRG